MRGIYIDIGTTKPGTFFNTVTSPLPIDEYNWYLEEVNAFWENDAISECRLSHINGSTVIGAQLREIMALSTSCDFGRFIGFSKVHLNSSDITSYEEFSQSEAEVGILVVDTQYYEIYCKNRVLIESLALNAKNKGFNYEFITNKNDARTSWWLF